MLYRVISPLFIIGAHRSGTTWVANALCNHARIMGVQAKEHFGIVESWFFSHLDGRFGDISNPENYAQFLDTFCRTAFSICSPVIKADLVDIHPANYSDFFHTFMVLAATKTANINNAPRYWLEKTPVHTLYVDRLIQYYPDAKFVAVSRSLKNVVISTLGMTISHDDVVLSADPWQLAKIVLHWAKYKKYLGHFRFSFPESVFYVRYEDLIERPAESFSRILKFIGLEWDSAILENRFKRNTSFPELSPIPLSKKTLRMLTFYDLLANYIPYSIFYQHENWRKPRNQEPVPYLMTEDTVNTVPANS